MPSQEIQKGMQGGSVGEGSELNPRNLHDRERELTPQVLWTSRPVVGTQILTDKQINVNEIPKTNEPLLDHR